MFQMITGIQKKKKTLRANARACNKHLMRGFQRLNARKAPHFNL